MAKVEVQSSNIKSVEWQEDNTLTVEYNSGTYKYLGVSKELYESLIKAESKGRFMNENIKGKFPYMKAML
jgi:hypothetical protein